MRNKRVADKRRKSRPRHSVTSKGGRKPSKLDVAMAEFQTRADAIMAAYRARLGKGLAPYQSAEGFLKREAYALIEETISQRAGKRVLSRIVTDWDIIPRSPSMTDNVFFWGLLAMDPEGAHDEREAEGDKAKLAALKEGNFLDRRKRSKYAMQLLYASKSRVPAQHLIGFLYQVGGPTELPDKLKKRGRDASLSLERPGVHTTP